MKKKNFDGMVTISKSSVKEVFVIKLCGAFVYFKLHLLDLNYSIVEQLECLIEFNQTKNFIYLLKE